jgi:hypothetical protein
MGKGVGRLVIQKGKKCPILPFHKRLLNKTTPIYDDNRGEMFQGSKFIRRK